MSNSDFVPDDGAFEVEHEPVERGFSILDHWVAFVDTTVLEPPGKALYWHYVIMADGRERLRDRLVSCTRDEAAAWLGYKDAKSVDRYNDQLEACGAIQVIRGRTRGGLRARNRVVIKAHPPEGYEGPRSLTEWRAARAAEDPQQPLL